MIFAKKSLDYRFSFRSNQGLFNIIILILIKIVGSNILNVKR